MTFNQKIIIQKKTDTTDNEGYTTTDWFDFKTLWCKANGISGKEFFANMSEKYENVVTFTVRYSKSICDIDTLNYRILFQGKIYNIVSIDNFEFRNQTIAFRSVEGVNNG